jgi:hypothetical protein
MCSLLYKPTYLTKIEIKMPMVVKKQRITPKLKYFRWLVIVICLFKITITTVITYSAAKKKEVS